MREIITDPDEAKRQEAEYEAKALPIREVIIGRRPGLPDMVVLWLDCKDRPDVADLARVHELEPSGYNGRFRIFPTMFATRDPLRFRLGFEISLFDPSTCAFQFLFDYYSNREWIMMLIQTGRFAIETGVPGNDGQPPHEGSFVALSVDANVLEQISMQSMLMDLALLEIQQTDAGLFQRRYTAPSLWRGQVWLARTIPAETQIKPPHVARGRQNRYRDN